MLIKKNEKMDAIDKKILEELQKNASIPLSELSKKLDYLIHLAGIE